MRHLPVALLSTACITLTSASAFAHAHLKSAVPAVDGTVQTVPKEVVITFTERLEEKLSKVEVSDAAGKRVDKADIHLLPGDAKEIAVSLGDLQPGTYTVTWTATSVDTHRTNGSFKFTLKP